MPNWTTITQDYKDALLKDLEGLLRIPSVKDPETASPQAPFGQGIQDALDYMLALGERDGFIGKDVDHYAAHLEIGQGDKLLGILSHLDVVPADPDQWETDPFQPLVRDGKLYARGALDDKGPTLMAYYAVKILKDLGYTFNQRIRLIYGTDEENDWQGVAHYFKKETMPDFGIVPDGIFPMIYAEKGVVNLYISKPFASPSLINLESGKAYNVVPDQATAKLRLAKSLKVTFEAYLKEHGLTGHHRVQDDLQLLELEGKSAHGAGPDQGINAALHLVHFLYGQELDQETAETLAWIDDHLWEDTQGKHLGLDFKDDQLGDVTINTAKLTLGQGQTTIGLNWRYPASYTFEKYYQELAQTLSTRDYGIQLVSHQKPSQAGLDNPETQLLLEVYRKHTGDQTPPLAIGGITYGRVFDRGITFGPSFLGKPATLHQPNEYIELEDLWKSLEIYLDSLYQLATVEGGQDFEDN